MKSNWKQITVVLIIGLLVGAAVGRWSTKRFHYKSGWDGKRFEHKLKHFSKKLNLSPEQQAQVRTIFEAKRDKIKSLHEDWRPKMKELREKSYDEIRALLNEDQKLKFEELIEKRRQWREKRRAKYRE